MAYYGNYGGGYGGYRGSYNPIKKASLINTIIIVMNVAYYLILEILGSTTDSVFMITMGADYWPLVFKGHQYWRLLTSAFMHFGFSHILGNMVVLAFIGDNLERALGRWKYILFYLVCAVGSGLCSCGVAMLLHRNSVSAGASGAIFGVAGGILYVLLMNHGRLEDLSVLQIGVFIIYTFYRGLISSSVDNIAHLSGAVIGFLMAMLLYRNQNKVRYRILN